MKLVKSILSILIILIIFIISTDVNAPTATWSQVLLREDTKNDYVNNPSDYLTGVSLYRRCYQMLIRKPLDLKNSVVKNIESGIISGEDACVRLINLATLDENGILVQPDLSKNETYRLLSTMQGLHSSWFEAYSFAFSGENFGTGEYVDFNQMGFALSHSLFKNKKISSILQGREIYQPIRDEKNINEYMHSRNPHNGGLNPWAFIGNYYQDGMPIEAKIPQAPRGVLRGIKIDNSQILLNKFYIQYDQIAEESTTTLLRHFGGGLLGNSTYLLLNMGDKMGSVQDGQMRIPRRWTKAVFKDILCRNLPVLKEKDAKEYVDPKAPHSYSRIESCVACHATMDHLVGGIRDIQGGVNNYEGLNFDNNKELIKNSKIGFSYLRSVHESKVLVPNENEYAFASPTGRLRMRDFLDRLIDEPYSNLDDLSQKLSQLDDFYTCQARRYFNFFTGIDVQTDPLLLMLANIKSEDKKILSQIYIWATELKKDQSIKKLIENIIRSPYYRHKYFSPIKQTSNMITSQ